MIPFGGSSSVEMTHFYFQASIFVCLKNPNTNRTSCVSVQGAEPGLQAGLLQAVAEFDKGRLERHRALQ